MLRRAWEAGASVPYPVEQTDHGLLMEYIGDESMAAPKLAQARLEPDALASAWAQLYANLRALTRRGWFTPIYRSTTCSGGRGGWC